jgi:hypothetical protein
MSANLLGVYGSLQAGQLVRGVEGAKKDWFELVHTSIAKEKSLVLMRDHR